MCFWLPRIISNVKSVLWCPTTPLQLQSWDATTHPSFWPSSAIWSWFKELPKMHKHTWRPGLSWPYICPWHSSEQSHLRNLESEPWSTLLTVGFIICTGQVGRTSIQLRPGKFDQVLRTESSSHRASRWLANLVVQLEETLSSQKKICRETGPSFPWFVPQPHSSPSAGFNLQG